MKYPVRINGYRLLVTAILVLTGTFAHANTCNLGVSGGSGDEGIGGTGILAQGLGGTGISADGAGTVAQGIGGTGSKVIANGMGGTGSKFADNGLGGTGRKVIDRGVGGTGGKVIANGMGGTGSKLADNGMGGTGIVGVITGFASICVNGVEAHYDNSTQVDVNGLAASIESLNVGQLVAIDAVGQGAEVRAQRVSVINALVGSVDGINTSKNQLRVMQQVVQLSNGQGAGKFKLGQTVAVSGLVAGNGVVQATRIDVVGSGVPASVTGPLSKGKVAGVTVIMPSKYSSRHADVANGANVQVSGVWDGSVLKVEEVRASATEQVMHPGQAFEVQGVLSQNGKTVNLQTLGKQITIGRDVKVVGDKNLKNAVVIIRGQISREGRAISRELEYRSFDKILERGGSKERPSIDHEVNKENSKGLDSRHNENSKKENSGKESSSKDNLGKENSEKNSVDHERNNSKTIDKIEKTERQKRVEKLDGVDKPEKVEKVDKVEKVEKVDRVEKVEKVDQIDRIEPVDRVEQVERVEHTHR